MTQTPNNKDIKLENAFVMYGDSIKRLKELPDNSVDSIVTDPPYGLSDNKYVADTIAKWINGERDFIPDGKGFMGKAWDSFVPPPAIWDECLRVLKPGGHLLAFFGSRTQDVGALSIRLAGFEIRDSIAWVYGSGFPKSMDISKAIDKRGGENISWFGEWLRKWREDNNITQKQVAELFPSKTGNLTGCVANWELGLNTPTAEQFSLICKTFNLPFNSIEEAEREVIGTTKTNTTVYQNIGGDNVSGDINITAPATDAAKKYEGWGTALKPAHEPIVVARKPISESTVANNVLQWGTGGLNIDASRIGNESVTINTFDNGAKPFGDAVGEPFTSRQSIGRFPANFILSHTEDCEDTGESTIVKSNGHWAKTKVTGFGDFGNGSSEYQGVGHKPGEESTPVFRCAEGCPVAELDKQSGVSKSTLGERQPNPSKNMNTRGDFAGLPGLINGHNDSGGASRFFYVAKASKKDRNEGMTEANNIHPTVKPTQLMEYLIKLVTPDSGTVLDPFTGSGSTGKAALLNGFKFIGCELTDEYLPIIEGRLSWASANKDKYQADKVAAVTKANKVAQNTRSKATGGSLTALDAAEVALQQIAAKKANKADNQLPLFDEVEESE